MYIGNNLQVANPSYKIIDDISSGFNGSTTSFALQVSGATPVPFPISTQQVMISVNGVVQEPDPSGSAGFKLLGSNIVFSSAPANGHAFFGTILAGADYVTAGSEFPDGSVTAPSFTFESDQDSGWYRISSGSVGYSANGVQTLNFDGNGLTIAAGKTIITPTAAISSAAYAGGGASPELYVKGTGGRTVKVHNPNSATASIQLTNATTGEGEDAGFQLAQLSGGDMYFDHHLAAKDIVLRTRPSGGSVTERLRLDSAGRLLLGTTTEGHASADDLTIAGTADVGITVRSGDDDNGSLFFSDATSGTGEYAGYVQYNHNTNALALAANSTIALTLDSSQNATFAGQISLSGELDFTGVADKYIDSYLYAGSGTKHWMTFRSVDSSNNHETALRYQFDGPVELFHDNVKRIQTESSGATITGNLTVNHSTNNQIVINAGDGALEICRSGAGAYIDFKNSTAEDYDARLQESSGGIVCTGAVSDSKGNLRSIPANEQNGSYTLVAADAGKVVRQESTGVTINTSVMTQGAVVTIINHSGSDQTITQGSGFTLYNTADASTGNRTLAQRGMATIWYSAQDVGYISGAGLS